MLQCTAPQLAIHSMNLLKHLRRLWTRYKLQARRGILTEGLREMRLDQEALDSSGRWADADSLNPRIVEMTLELRDVEHQLRNT